MINTIVVGGQYTDPTEYTGPETDWCKRCQSNEKYDDTDVCESCIDELEEMSEYSVCCTSRLHTDTNRCTECLEWSESEFDDFCNENNFNPKTYRYEY